MVNSGVAVALLFIPFKTGIFIIKSAIRVVQKIEVNKSVHFSNFVFKNKYTEYDFLYDEIAYHKYFIPVILRSGLMLDVHRYIITT